MQQRNSSPWATILMGIPLAAMPLMAIFGIPNLAPLSAQTSELNAFFQSPPTDNPQTGMSGGFGQTDFGSAERIDSSTAPAWNGGSTRPGTEPSAQHAQSVTATEGTSVQVPWQQTAQQTNPSWSASETQQQQSTVQLAGYERAIPSQTSAAPTGQNMSGEGVTWQSAMAQLQQWGIQNYRLQAGSRPDQFLFICFVTPADNPRLTIRYEAEASDPLDAVSNVLSQIQQNML